MRVGRSVLIQCQILNPCSTFQCFTIMILGYNYYLVYMVLMINILSLDIRTRRPPLVLAVVAGVINSDIIEVLKAKLKAYNIYMYIQKQKLLHTMQSCTDLTHKLTNKQYYFLCVCVWWWFYMSTYRHIAGDSNHNIV